MNMFIRISLGLTLLVSLAACEDHRLAPNQPRFRLKTLTVANRTVGVSPILLTLNYDQAGKLANYVASFAGGSQTATLQYNPQNQLVNIDIPAVTGVSYAVPGANKAKATYEYDASGNLVTVKTYYDADNTGSLALRETYTLLYNADKQPSTLTRTVGADTKSESYTYSAGNVSRIDRHTGSVMALDPYDGKPNPLYGLRLFSPIATLQNPFTGFVSYTAGSGSNFYGFIDSPAELFSQSNFNNPTSNLTYNSDGLLSKRLTNYLGGLNLQFTSTYTYEVY